MLKITPVLLITASAIASAAPTGAQVTKPGPTDRLPAPAMITAVQVPDGTIRVTWSTVEGALGYTLARSVPPVPIAPVTLANPSDTVYIDRDVKSGSTYYYLVAAVNEAGLPGLKRGSAPGTTRCSGQQSRAQVRGRGCCSMIFAPAAGSVTNSMAILLEPAWSTG